MVVSVSATASSKPVLARTVSTETPGCRASRRIRRLSGSKPKTPRVVTTRATPPKSSPLLRRLSPPSSQPGLVMKSTVSEKRRFSCTVRMMTSRQSEMMSLAPPLPGSRTLGRS